LHTCIADPIFSRVTTQTTHLAWLCCWDHGQMGPNSVSGAEAILPPLFFLLEAGIPRHQDMVVAHLPTQLCLRRRSRRATATTEK
jgi:hypothetical protein